MSSTSSSMVLLLLCFSFYSCNARPIGVTNKEIKMAKSSHFHSKNEEKSSDHARVSISSNEKPSTQNISEAAKEDVSFLVENTVNKNNQGTRAQKLEEEKAEVKDDDHKSPPKVGANDHAVQTKPLATVSWKLPQRKRGERQPGFNLDYDPPRTHPPVHN